MLIGIDAHYASYQLRGIGKYVVQLVSGLVHTDQSNEYLIYGDPQMFSPLSGCSNVRFRNPTGLPYPVWEQLVLPVWARIDRLDLLHCPANTAPLLLPRDLRLVITVHDVMYLLPASDLSASKVFRQRLGNFYRRRIVPLVAGRASCIIAVSEFSKGEIAEYLKIVPNRIRAIHEGISADFPSLADAIETFPRKIGEGTLDSPFILALGADDPRKNTIAVIRAYATSWHHLPNREKLVIVGLRDWRTSPLYGLVMRLGLNERVVFAGYVPEELLAWLYRSSSCFLYPSLYEGFGFPVLEAMACGAPVIASNNSSVSEIAGNAAILVDPSCEKSISDALLRLLCDERLRRHLIEQGRARIEQFSWQETIRKTLGVYTELGGCRVEQPSTVGAN
jgi:glycosyltransferase involved in cell wall biosynthesis